MPTKGKTAGGLTRPHGRLASEIRRPRLLEAAQSRALLSLDHDRNMVIQYYLKRHKEYAAKLSELEVNSDLGTRNHVQQELRGIEASIASIVGVK